MFTLYVAQSKRRPSQHDVGSVLCLRTMQNVPEGIVQVVRCETLGHRPKFLRGTPTLVDQETQEVYTGHHAVHRMHLLSLFHAERYGRMQSGKEPRPEQPGPLSARRTVAEDQEAAAPSRASSDDAMDLWKTAIVEEGVEDDEPSIGERKLTSDDLARVAADRGANAPRLTTAPPPPPPPSHD